MKINWIERLGDKNPQFLRELQELQFSSLLIAVAISFLGQFLLFIFYQGQLPISYDSTPISHKFCINDPVSEYENQLYCLRDNAGNFVIHWQLWWLNLFTFLSLFGIATLLTGGVYLLVNNLATEQRRCTLNFIRLTPQSPQTILLGKLLGVPSLLYFVFILAIPLHLWAGLSAKIPLLLILSFYLVLIVGCFFFYSAAILFGLVSSSFKFAPWLASGTVLLFLLANHYSITGTLVDWLFLFSPIQIVPYLVEATHLNSNSIDGWLILPSSLYSKHWFHIQIGSNATNLLMSSLLNYSLWSYWVWQAIKQCYSKPKNPLLTKKQSYFLVVCFELVILGFTLVKGDVPAWKEGMIYHYRYLLIFNLVMFLALIMLMTPSRQCIHWGRSSQKHNRNRQQFVQNLMRQDSVLLTIGVNLAIASAFLIPWILFNLEASDQIPALISLLICYNFILICAVITQIIGLRITQKPALWITGTFGIITILPVIVINLLARNSDETPMLWLFTPYAWAVTKLASQVNILFAILIQWTILGLCTLQMRHDIKKLGESASKALFTGSNLHSKR